MRVSFSRINVFSAGLNFIFGRTRTSKVFSSSTLALPSSSLVEDEVLSLEDSKFAVDLLPDFDCISTERAIQNELCFGDADLYQAVNNDSFNCACQNAENEKLERIKFILRRRGWILYGHRIDLNHSNVVLILNDLFDASWDAALALDFFLWVKSCTGSEHTIRSMCTMIHILVAGNMNYRAVDLILWLSRKNSGEDWWLNLLLTVLYETHVDRRSLVTACSMLVGCYIKENLTDVAFKFTCLMKQFNIFPSLGVCNSLLKALLGSGQLELALEFLQELHCRGLGYNASIISLFISNCCREGNFEAGLKLLTEMKSYKINADVVAYTIVIDSLCKWFYLKEAISLLFKMNQMGVSIDSVCVSSVIHGLCKVGELKKAIDILEIFRLPPNIYVYNSFISKLCADGDIVAACNTFHEMSGLGLLPDCYSYTTIIGGYCKAGEIDKALIFFGRMLKRGIKPSVTTYTIFIEGYFNSGDMGMAERLFQQMMMEGMVPDIVAYNTLMDGYSKKGHLHKAFELLDKMRSVNMSPNIVTYNSLIHGLSMRGFVTEAKNLLDELIRRGFSPDVVTFTTIINGLSKKGNFEEAFLVWFYMSEHGMKPDVVTCSALLNGYCRERRMEEAHALFFKMLDIGLVPDLLLYNTLIHGFCSVGNIDNASDIVNMMAECGIIPNEVTHRAFVLGYEKKRMKHPAGAATLKLRQILLKHNIIIDIDITAPWS